MPRRPRIRSASFAEDGSGIAPERYWLPIARVDVTFRGQRFRHMSTKAGSKEANLAAVGGDASPDSSISQERSSGSLCVTGRGGYRGRRLLTNWQALLKVCEAWPVRLSVRTRPSQG